MILIVDDKPENIFSLKTILELNSFPTDTALSGEEALKKILRQSYALIILDVQMPGMDGLQLQTQLAAEGCVIPVIFITAHDDQKSRRRALRAGAVAFLDKPFTDQRLLQAIRSVLRHDEGNLCGGKHGRY